MFEVSVDGKRAIISLNHLAQLCGSFFNAQFDPSCKALPNNGYNCRHPGNESEEEGVRCCLTWSCPYAWEADEEDCMAFGVEHEEGEYMITEDPYILQKLKNMKKKRCA